MKKLELNEMEVIIGGELTANCVGAVAGGVGLFFGVVTVLAGIAIGPVGWIGLAMGGASFIASNWNGDPCAYV